MDLQRSNSDRLEITAQLLLHDIKDVIVVARSEDKFNTALEDWPHRGGMTGCQEQVRVHFVPCDLADIAAVKAAAEKIKELTDRVHLFFCNAGRFATK
jgi:NAD(P)-dependent dehydrogenase (short-subunit alcohol dehydrogenase family)